jgi:hypothetical protein
LPVINFPEAIVAAYLERKGQLDRMVKATGARHISGLQPGIFSKRPSTVELESMNNPNRRWRNVFERVPYVYGLLSEALATQSDLTVLNFHREFKGFSSDQTLFQDYMHTTPLGEQRIAESYSHFIIDRGML